MAAKGHGHGAAVSEDNIVKRIYDVDKFVSQYRTNQSAHFKKHFGITGDEKGPKMLDANALADYATHAHEHHLERILGDYLGVSKDNARVKELANEFSLTKKQIKEILTDYAKGGKIAATDEFISRLSGALASASEDRIYQTLGNTLRNFDKAQLEKVGAELYGKIHKPEELAVLKKKKTEEEMAGKLIQDFRGYLQRDFADQRAKGQVPTYSGAGYQASSGGHGHH